jgi:hypothetical protein
MKCFAVASLLTDNVVGVFSTRRKADWFAENILKHGFIITEVEIDSWNELTEEIQGVN